MPSAPDPPQWTLPTLMVLIDARFDALEKALDLQAAEYKRRLDALNHAHELAQAKEAGFVSVEKYDDFLRRYDDARAATAKALTLAEGKDTGQSRTIGILVGAFGFLLTVISIVIVAGDVLTP